MKLWYTKWELPEAEKEARRIIDDILRDIHLYVKGDVQIRMAWRGEERPRDTVPLDEWKRYMERALPIFIPEAELLVDGEVIRRDLLDLLYLDILHVEMNVLQRNGKGDFFHGGQ